MSDQLTMYKPEDNVLSDNLTKKGHKAASKRLSKEKKKTFPKLGTPGDLYIWWQRYKEGKKKDKIAMCIMAYHYPMLVMHLDQCQRQVSQLENKTESQEKEISLLKQKLQQEKQEIKQLKKNLSTINNDVGAAKRESLEKEIALLRMKLLQEEVENERLNEKVSQLKSKTESQKKNITELQQKVQEQDAEYEQLQVDALQNSSRLPVPLTSSMHRSFSFLLSDLPDLQYDHSNYEFWMKIKKWLCNGEVTPQCVFKLVQKKCPREAWQNVADEFKNNDLTETAFSNPIKAGRLMENLWKCVSEALGPGTKYFEVYYKRRQEPGETFERYIEEKLKLYCSYGMDTPEPNRNDPNFLYNVIEKSTKSYKNLIRQCPKSYSELTRAGMLINMMLTTAECENKCLNCDRKGHTQAQCRRPGGDAAVGPNQCYTCGGYGHWARRCWH